MKKVLLILGIAAGYWYYTKEKTVATNSGLPIVDILPPPPPPLGLEFEGQIVIAPNGNWLYIKNQKSYYVSHEALNSYNDNGGKSAISLTQEQADRFFPVSGEVLANLELKPF